MENIELGFGIGINQSRANAEARKCAEKRIHEKCVIGTRLRNNLKIRQVTLGTEDHLDLGYLSPKPTDCHSDGSLSCLTRHITEKSKEKQTAEFLALVQRENQLELKMKQEMTQREEIRTKLYIGNILGKTKTIINFDWSQVPHLRHLSIKAQFCLRKSHLTCQLLTNQITDKRLVTPKHLI